jgi:hypothetical protein
MIKKSFINRVTLQNADFDWNKVLNKSVLVDNHYIHAHTMSVIGGGENVKTAHVGVYIVNADTATSEYFTLTARWDQDPENIRLCGYRNEFKLWNEPLDPYSDESETFEVYLDYGGELDADDWYISKDIERTILEQIRNSVRNQFRSKLWVDYTSPEQRKQILKIFSNTIKGMR